MGRDGRNLPQRPTGRPPGDVEQPRPDYASSRDEDVLLSGPWETSPRSEDGPLSGPWDISTRGEDAPLPGPWEQECSTGAENKPQSPTERENEPQFPRQQREQTNPAGDPPLVLGEQDRPRRLLNVAPQGDADHSDQPVAPLSRPIPATDPSRWRCNAGNPLAAALSSKNALVGSMIIGDVLNSRGGRIKKRPGQF